MKNVLLSDIRDYIIYRSAIQNVIANSLGEENERNRD